MSESQCPSVNPSSVEYKFPWDSQPEDRTTPLSCQKPENYLSIRKDPLEALGYIASLIRAHINNPDVLHRDSIKELIRLAPIEVSGVEFQDKTEQGTRPRLYVKYTGMKSQQDFAVENSVGYNMSNAEERFFCRWTLGFSVEAVSRQYSESLLLSEEVRLFLHYFQSPIKKSLCWDKLQVVEASAPVYEETLESFSSSVTCIALFGDSWTLRQAAPLLKTANLSASSL